MGKRKKVPNVVKVDIGDCGFKKGEILPLLVQHSSKDGRRVGQTVHKIPTPRQNPPPSTFDPSPVPEDIRDYAFPDVGEPIGELAGSEHVSSCFFVFGRCILTCAPI